MSSSPSSGPDVASARRLRAVAVTVLVLAGVGSVVPGRAGTVLAGTALALLAATPVLRVAALARRWWVEGDRRFVAAAAGVLFVVAAGPALALLTP